MLLGYAGKNKTGRKNELQHRAIEIAKSKNPTFLHKIKELYKSIQWVKFFFVILSWHLNFVSIDYTVVFLLFVNAYISLILE